MMSWRMILPPGAAGPQPARRRGRECPSPLRLHADSGSRPVRLEVLPTQPPSPALRLTDGFGRATQLLPLGPLMTTSCRPHLLDVSGESHSRGIWGAFFFHGCGDSGRTGGPGQVCAFPSSGVVAIRPMCKALWSTSDIWAVHGREVAPAPTPAAPNSSFSISSPVTHSYEFCLLSLS